MRISIGFFIKNIFLLGSLMSTFSLVAAPPKKVVLIAGEKSHGEGDHEYLKSVKLLKYWLDTAPNLKGLKTEIHFNDWPEDSSTLNTADVIVLLSDGEASHPFLKGGRMKFIEKQMKRGCGLVLFHYSTFTPLAYSEQFLNWTGGFFDYESGDFEKTGPEAWASAIKFETTNVSLAESTHPICRGISAFELKEEFYYKIKFKKNDTLFKPILNASIPGVSGVQTVAWAIERQDGGRGFGFTGGHVYKNWEIPQFRKVILNAIIWASGMGVPAGGVESKFVIEEEAVNKIYGKPVKGLLLTGYNSPEHDWASTTSAIDNALESNPRLMVEVSNSIEDLATKDLSQYNFLILNYNNWDKPGLSEKAKTNFIKYLSDGGGLMIVHFANGAFHASLPSGENADWPEYRKICRRVWDHKSDSNHDEEAKLKVLITNPSHRITKGIKSFETVDEIYFNQKESLPVEILVSAKSTKTNRIEPLAWVYTYGKGKIFQTVLGHDSKSLHTIEVQQLLKNAAFWVSGN